MRTNVRRDVVGLSAVIAALALAASWVGEAKAQDATFAEVLAAVEERRGALPGIEGHAAFATVLVPEALGIPGSENVPRMAGRIVDLVKLTVVAKPNAYHIEAYSATLRPPTTPGAAAPKGRLERLWREGPGPTSIVEPGWAQLAGINGVLLVQEGGMMPTGLLTAGLQMSLNDDLFAEFALSTLRLGRATMAGTQNCDGLDCIVVEQEWNDGTVHVQRSSYLCPERDYLCVRSESRQRFEGEAETAIIDRVLEFRQTQNGVWIPAVSTRTILRRESPGTPWVLGMARLFITRGIDSLDPTRTMFTPLYPNATLYVTGDGEGEVLGDDTRDLEAALLRGEIPFEIEEPILW